MFRRISLGKWGLILGIGLTALGIAAYIGGYPTLNLAAFFSGVPLALIGLALKAAELKPIPYSEPPSPELRQLRDAQATPILKLLRQNVTRYRYGHEAHLDESLERLGLAPSREERPVLKSIREADWDGRYALVLRFASPHVPLESWQERQAKIERFFGPGVQAALTPSESDAIELALIATGEPSAAEAEGS